jgi:hypothetical protein
MYNKSIPVALSALILSGASFLSVAADDTTKPAANQGTNMEQPDKAKADQGAQVDASKDTTTQMKSLDADGDGAISKAEAGKMKGMADGFETADANKDGKLDANEFTTAMSKMKK